MHLLVGLAYGGLGVLLDLGCPVVESHDLVLGDLRLWQRVHKPCTHHAHITSACCAMRKSCTHHVQLLRHAHVMRTPCTHHVRLLRHAHAMYTSRLVVAPCCARHARPMHAARPESLGQGLSLGSLHLWWRAHRSCTQGSAWTHAALEPMNATEWMGPNMEGGR